MPPHRWVRFRMVIHTRPYRGNAVLLPPGEDGDSDVELLEDDSDAEFLAGGGEEGKEETEL